MTGSKQAAYCQKTRLEAKSGLVLRTKVNDISHIGRMAMDKLPS